MYLSKKVESITFPPDKREWVEIDDFLAVLPNVDGTAKEDFRFLMRMMNHHHVEKRVHDVLFQGLNDRCLSRPGHHAFSTPTVTKDGWVFWADGYHQKLLEVLAALYQGTDVASDDDFFRNNIGWTISTMDCKRIMVPKDYRPNKEDAEIFEFFTLRIM